MKKAIFLFPVIQYLWICGIIFYRLQIFKLGCLMMSQNKHLFKVKLFWRIFEILQTSVFEKKFVNWWCLHFLDERFDFLCNSSTNLRLFAEILFILDTGRIYATFLENSICWKGFKSLTKMAGVKNYLFFIFWTLGPKDTQGKWNIMGTVKKEKITAPSWPAPPPLPSVFSKLWSKVSPLHGGGVPAPPLLLFSHQ